MTAARFALVALLLTANVLIVALAFTRIPRCEEDQVIVGVGAYTDGRWSVYECGPALDDFAE